MFVDIFFSSTIAQLYTFDRNVMNFCWVFKREMSVTVNYSVNYRGEQQLLFELAINSGDFYVKFQRENHFINKRLQEPRRLNFKCMPAVSNVNTLIVVHQV
jgi:hypothetical protein